MTLRAVRDYVRKANYTSSAIDSNGGLLNADQFQQFLRVAINNTVMLREGRIESSKAKAFEVARINFSTRILKSGTENTRTTDSNRVAPATGLLSLTTQLFRGEVPVSDELLEDNIEGPQHADTLMSGIAERVGLDVEILGIQSDTSRNSNDDAAVEADLGKFDGIIASAQDNFPSAQKIDATSLTADAILEAMIEALPSKYRQRNWSELRLYVPTQLMDGYWGSLEGRATSLGDVALTGDQHTSLRKRGIPVVEVPSFSGTSTIDGTDIDYSTFAILTHPKNVTWAFHRDIRIEKFRDPREGTTSFLPTVRFDLGFSDPGLGVLASSVPTSF